MPTVHTNGIRTYYEEYGNGQPIVFLHGGTMDLRVWAEQARPLADTYRVIAYDIRGHGRTGLSDHSTYTIDLFTEDLHAFTSALDLDRPAICGLSLGGMIAFAYANRYPESVSAVIVLGALTPDVFSRSEWFRRRGVYRFIDRASTVFSHDRVVAGVNWIFDRIDSDVDTGDIEEAAEIASRHADEYPEMDERELDKLWGEWSQYLSMEVDYTELAVPMLFLYGEHEFDVVATHARHVANHVPRGDSREVPRAGHFSHVDNPQFLTATIREFLSDVTTPEETV